MSTQHKFTTYNPELFDKSRIVIKDPVKNEFTINDMPISTTMSEGFYVDDEGDECELYIPCPPQSCFGVNYFHDMSVKKEDQSPENAKGLQICYQATSMKTMNNPTPGEAGFISLMDTLWELAVEKGKFEASREELLIPDPSAASCLSAEKRKRMDLFVKPPLEYSKSKDKKTLDKTKPKRCYVKLVTTGRGPTLKALTRFFGPNDKQVSPLRYIDTRGIITPCFKWEGIFWGAHGPNSPHGASLRFKLIEANYEPMSAISLPTQRMLPRNTAVAMEEDSDDFSEPHANGEGDGFAAPGDVEDPFTALATASKQARKPAAKAPVAIRPTSKAPVAIRPTSKAPVATRPVVKNPAVVKPVAKVPVRKAAPVPLAKPKPLPIRRAPPPPEDEDEVELEDVVDDDE